MVPVADQIAARTLTQCGGISQMLPSLLPRQLLSPERDLHRTVLQGHQAGVLLLSIGACDQDERA
jgi:hypothetical protein